MATCTLVDFDYRSVLRDICDSEELKIDSKNSKKIKETLQQLCLDGDGRGSTARRYLMLPQDDVATRAKSTVGVLCKILKIAHINIRAS